ncbi:MAG TPA: hypothetical protein OIM48_02885 [Clostridiaceae bacterium]|jgi:hypothetical protein|nr:hypothetical protein [Clostridium sp.]MEE0127996.1 hypothetical protein [Clostridia bacterium]HJJ12235.1 hypothetical protein [Clostridiaceae bacterium]
MKKTNVFLKKIGRRYWLISKNGIVSFIGKVEPSEGYSVVISDKKVPGYTIKILKVNKNKYQILLELLTVFLRNIEKYQYEGKYMVSANLDMYDYNIETNCSWAIGNPKEKGAKFRVEIDYCTPKNAYNLICHYIELAKQSSETDEIMAYDIDMMG